MRDSEALPTVPERPAQLKLGARRALGTELETLLIVARPCVQKYLVPAVNHLLDGGRSNASEDEKRRCHTHANELLAFLLQLSMEALL